MNAADFIKALRAQGCFPFTGVPDSIFQPLINCLETEGGENYICSSEGEAMGIAGGFAFAGRIPVVYMQNDGYGNAVNPLSSLQLMNKLPALLLISWRAEPGQKDEPQHWIMGETILALLDIFKIPYRIFDEAKLEQDLDHARNHFKKNSTPFALIIRKGAFAYPRSKVTSHPDGLNFRHEYISLLAEHADEDSLLLGATGYCGRELYQLVQSPNKFYMMGSMGCLAAMCLGISKAYPRKKIFALDGDGAVLMHMGTLSTIGYHKPENFIHVCFDNAQYESTGGQKTTSSATDLAAIAKACGYPSVSKLSSIDGLRQLLKAIDRQPNPHFIHITIKPGTIEDLARPKIEPVQMKIDFVAALDQK